MQNIQDLLQRIKSALNKDELLKENIILSVEEVSKIKLDQKFVSVKNDTIHIKTSPVRANEIKLNEEKILNKVREKTGLNLKKILY